MRGRARGLDDVNAMLPSPVRLADARHDAHERERRRAAWARPSPPAGTCRCAGPPRRRVAQHRLDERLAGTRWGCARAKEDGRRPGGRADAAPTAGKVDHDVDAEPLDRAAADRCPTAAACPASTSPPRRARRDGLRWCARARASRPRRRRRGDRAVSTRRTSVSGADAKVRPAPHLGHEVAARRAHAHAVHQVHRVRPGARRRGIVRVVAPLVTERGAGLEERGLPRRELRRACAGAGGWGPPASASGSSRRGRSRGAGTPAAPAPSSSRADPCEAHSS